MNLNASMSYIQNASMSYIQNNLLRNFVLPDMRVGYQKFKAGSPDGYLDFCVISTLAYYEK